MLALRQEKSKPILEKFKAWVDDLLPGTPPNSALGKALGYAIGNGPSWCGMWITRKCRSITITSSSRSNITRPAERHGSSATMPAGAQASANLFSLVMTCRVNDIEPYAYLNHLFEHLPAASTVEQIEALLPWNVKAMLEEQKQSQQRPATVRRLTRQPATPA